MIGLLIVVMLVLLACGGIPLYGGANWAAGSPYNLFFVVAFILLILILMRRI